LKVLITGGAGFVGSTVASACEDAGHTPVLLDDLSRGASAFAKRHAFYQGDVADSDVIQRIFAEHSDIAVAVHCAAAVIVPESVTRPLHYYRTNVAKTIDLVRHLVAVGCRRVLFSSSAAVYAASTGQVVDESSPVRPASPYARSKTIAERALHDAAKARLIDAISLRYFNPVGADPKLRTGLQIVHPTHAWGRLIESYRTGAPFTITGVEWPTRDGTAMRDYIHVWDVARAHVRAVERFDAVLPAGGYDVINIGTGSGTTVRELVAAFQHALGVTLEVVEAPARVGDVLGCYAAVDRAAALLDWRAELPIEQAFGDGVAWARIRDRVLSG
jgi:UDP-glucose 4-epimerase